MTKRKDERRGKKMVLQNDDIHYLIKVNGLYQENNRAFLMDINEGSNVFLDCNY